MFDSNCTPVTVPLTGAHQGEIKLIEPTQDRLQKREHVSKHLIYDRAPDCNLLRRHLWKEPGVKLVRPHRKWQKNFPHIFDELGDNIENDTKSNEHLVDFKPVDV